MRNLIFILLAMLVLISCKPEIKGELGESFSKVEGLNGSWQMHSFSQRDENNPIKEIRDLSTYYIIPGEAPTSIAFNSSDKTYTVDPGPGRNYFGTQGTWRFDSDDAPSVLYLYQESDTLELKLGSMPRTFDNQVSLELPRYCGENPLTRTATVTYIFTLQRIN